MFNESIRSKCCYHKNQKQYYLETNSYYINDENNDKEDEINSYNDANNVGDNSGNNNDEDKVSQFEANHWTFKLLEIGFLKFLSPGVKHVFKCPT